MITESDVPTISKAIAGVVRRHISQTESMTAQIERLQDRIDLIPVAVNGKDGKDGQSVDVDTLRSMFSVEVQKAIDSIPKPLDGKDGEAGLKGDHGPSGKDGDPGGPGESGVAGPRGEKGIDGRDGREGKDGRDGSPGKDAAQIEIVPLLDLSKSYPRGTFASHNGGLIHSLRNTDPITDGIEKSGWAVIIDGVASLNLAQSDARAFSLSIFTTSGKSVELTFSVPTMIYRGVFREGDKYEKGDTVTWAGSLWHANEATNDRPGDAGKSWTLAAKRGANGKDALVMR